MFLSQKIDIKMCQIYTDFIYIQFCIKIGGLNISFSTNTQQIWKRLYPTGAWESQVCSYYIFDFFFFIFNRYDIIDNIITYNPYSSYYVARTSANDSTVSYVTQTEITWPLFIFPLQSLWSRKKTLLVR